MKKSKPQFRSTCPISTALDIFGDKLSLLIIRDMLFKWQNTYGGFLNGGEHIATNILADRLSLLECAGIVIKAAHPDSKAKVLYKLTKKGADLAPILIEAILWSEKYYEVHPQAVAFAEDIRKDKAAVLGQIYAQLNED